MFSITIDWSWDCQKGNGQMDLLTGFTIAALAGFIIGVAGMLTSFYKTLPEKERVLITVLMIIGIVLVGLSTAKDGFAISDMYDVAFSIGTGLISSIVLILLWEMSRNRT
jgi:hypothetical protein